MQINLKLDCTLYSGLGVHFHRNTQLVPTKPKAPVISMFIEIWL